MSKINVIVNGAKGKMGAEAVNAVNNAEDMELVAQTDLGDDLAKSISDTNADIVVDLTAPSCAYDNAQIILNSAAGGVIGTTGFTAEQIEELTKKAKKKSPAILIAPNFSIGAVLMMHCSEIIAKHMPDVEIIELHHPTKKDAPSGTAIKTAELIEKARGNSNVPRGTSEPPARGAFYGGIPVHSVRLPGLLAHQQVLFGGEGQTLSLKHDSLNRGCFMPGVLLGVRKIMTRKGLIYGLDNLLF
jgi:4-hydroxy-tetrahydrodipicolinate reductase